MKRLTISRVSAASIRANKKTYASLAIGILLAVFLAATATLCVYGVIAAMGWEVVQKIGYTDCVLYDEPDVTDESLRENGLFDRIGKMFVTASVKDSGVWLGYLDETGTDILCRSCIEGRMPEAPGEIAVEQSALERLRLETGVGDTVTWTLTPVDGVEEERTFTIVGILREQSANLDISDIYWSSDGLLCWPSVLVSAEESGFRAGRTAIHRIMTYAPLASYHLAKNFHSLVDTRLFPVSRADGSIVFRDPGAYDATHYLEQTSVLWVLGLSLLLAVSIGISSAMESVLAAKTEEIGMLRAVGATRRQIRRIFGRDTWILSIVILPVGVLLGVLAAWLLCSLSPVTMMFSVKAWLLLPVVAISAFCIFIASALPLRRASRQMPMGVLRDTGLLRKTGKLRSRTKFRAAELIAGRQLRIHPLRQLGAALMVTATLLCTSFVGEMSYDALAELAKSHPVAFQLYSDTGTWQFYDFAVTRPQSILTGQDLAQIRSIPEVEHAAVVGQTDVNLLFSGQVPAYFGTQTQQQVVAYDENGKIIYHIFNEKNGLGYLDIGEEDPQPVRPAEGAEDPEKEQAWHDHQLYQQMKGVMDAQGLEGKPVPFTLTVADLEHADWTDRIAEGKVDLAAIDAGQQVLVYAPPVYIYKLDQGYIATTQEHFLKDGPVDELQNDYFQAGQTLSLVQFINEVPSEKPDTYDGWRADYSQMERHDADVTVGAVLDGKPLVDGMVSIITTEKGAEAMGIDLTTIADVNISLTGNVDMETEQALQTRLTGIAMRGDMKLYNNLQGWREELASIRQVLLLSAGIMLLFFAVAVAMQVGNAGRRIRSDSRMIGTLRAVGADEKALLGCYRLSMILTTVVGTVLAVIVYVMFVFWYHREMHEWMHPWTVVPAMLVLGLICALCCLAGVRARLKNVLSRSIVENIREL